MSIYHRYASREHDEAFFKRLQKTRKVKGVKHAKQRVGSSGSLKSLNSISISPLCYKYEESDEEAPEMSIAQWTSIFPNAAFFTAYDDPIFGYMLTLVYQSLETGKISTTSLSQIGVSSYSDLLLDPKSRFWPSCENLLPQYQKSNVRKSLAITYLKNFNSLSNNPNFNGIKRWDETNAGSLANSTLLLTEKTPQQFGLKLLQLGLLQNHSILSVILDTVYDNFSEQATEKIVEENNKLVYLLGEQLDQLFDPLLEYSPEAMNITYTVPEPHAYTPPMFKTELINSIVDELLTVQTNFTMSLVNLLQNFIIPLRIHVLGASANLGIAKINHVFPPTIDEITRINCILHDSLNKASKYGYVEVFKVMGMILPYFYKAFIRHEANLKRFTSRINKFNHKNQKKIFHNKNINKGDYSINEIDSIVSGSLLELPKLKLILRRLYDSYKSEKMKIVNFEHNVEDRESYVIEIYYNSAIDVIDAFGAPSDEHVSKINTRERFFTPTGRILTELASNWPPELQYNWLSRKVVGIYELKNVKPEKGTLHDNDILIIFSDYLLFMTIDDDAYYLKKDEDPLKTISVSDILMHSLINEKPLPHLKNFPSMKVSCWCGINEVITTCYKSVSSEYEDETEVDFLRFLSISPTGFFNNSDDKVWSKNFEILHSTKLGLVDGHKIMELITKSKVLHKNQTFHLFKSIDSNLNIYSTAHNIDAYEVETCKSPFALFLNITFDEPYQYLDSHPGLYLIIGASFISDERVQLFAYNKSRNYHLDDVVVAQDLQYKLKEILNANLQLLFKSFESVTTPLTSAYQHDLEYYLGVFTSYNTRKLKHEMIEKASKQAKEEESKKRVAEQHAEKEKKQKISETRKVAEPSVTNLQKPKKRSFLQRLFKPFKRSNGAKTIPKTVPTTAPKTTPKTAPNTTPNTAPFIDTPRQNNQTRNISQTFVPRGQKKEYKGLYKPIPDLQSRESSISLRKESIVLEVPRRDPSLVVNNQFNFPAISKIHLKVEPEVSHNISSGQTIHDTDVMERTKLAASASCVPRSMSEENVLVLDSVTRRKVKSQPRVAPYVDLEKLPVEEFYTDGESNWMTISRDNSSLYDEVSKLTLEPVIEHEENENTHSTILVSRHISNSSQDTFDLVGKFATTFDDEDKFFSPYNEQLSAFEVPANYFVAENKEESMQSLDSSQIIDAFKKTLDMEFKIDSEDTDTIQENQREHKIQNNQRQRKNQDLQRQHKNPSILTLTSSEEEYFSPNEFEFGKLPNHRPREDDNDESPHTYESVSSEATVINEFFEERPRINFQQKALPSLPLEQDLSFQSFSLRVDSVAYLSELFDGNMDLDQESILSLAK